MRFVVGIIGSCLWITGMMGLHYAIIGRLFEGSSIEFWILFISFINWLNIIIIWMRLNIF